MTDSTLNSPATTYFEFDDGISAFEHSFVEAMNEAYRAHTSRFMTPENTQRFYHGGSWSHPANPSVIGGASKVHSAMLEASFKRIIENDLNLIPESINNVAQQMGNQFFSNVFSTMSDACNASGNVVDAKAEGSLAASFIAMLEKIEFVVDKDGTVHMPELHANGETARQLITALEAEPLEFQEKVEALKQRKISEANEREAARKAKFVRYGT